MVNQLNLSRKRGGNIQIKYKKFTRKFPNRYLPRSLNKKDRKKQIKSIFERTNRPKVNYKSKKSSWTKQFHSFYDQELNKLDGRTNLKNISTVTKIPLKALQAVYKKGYAAFYTSGSRPNQTADSWALARVFSYIMGGNTRKIDNEITVKYNVKFKH